MSTKKREIYARAAVQLRTHDRAVRAEQGCPGAMGLYLWMLLQARGEESDGDVLEAAAVTAWGAPPSYRRRQLEALIAVGLVERIADGRLMVIKYAEHNDDRKTIAANRKKYADKKRHQRHLAIANDNPMSPGDTSGTTQVVPISSSISISDLESRSEEPDSSPRARVVADALSPPPPWWGGVCETVAAGCLGRSDALSVTECWLAYAGHRNGKGRPPERNDAVQWLTQVMVPKAKDRIRAEAHQRDRDAKFDAERRQQRTGPEMPKQTPEQARRDAQRFAAQIAARKGVA